MTDVSLRAKGKRHACKIEISVNGSRLNFKRAPFAMKDEIKAMKGARWHPDARHWSVANHPRNHFQIKAMMVEPENPNPYEWFERELELITDFERPLQEQQIDMVSKALFYRYQIFAAEMGLGKTLTAIEIMERLNDIYGWEQSSPEGFGENVWFVGPKSALESVQLDLHKWACPYDPTLKTYERMVIDFRNNDENIPQCLFLDECSGLKNPTSHRAKAAQGIADAIREKHGTDGCVILLSGTPTAKRPSDIWSQAEIAWPGFLREGSLKAFEARYAIITHEEDMDGVRYPVLHGWKDEEVERIPARLDGLMTVYRKDDYLNLPERTFEIRNCPPEPRTIRVAKALVDSAPNVITGLTWLRQLSSGFQYDKDGVDDKITGERALVETYCPKDDAFCDILHEESTRGRMIAFASFQGSIDRVKRLCQDEGWDVITVDGRGWNCYDHENNRIKQHILDFWANNENPTVFVGNPQSCRFGLTLVEAVTAVVYDQNFSAECRLQSLDRNYRIGQTLPVRVIDLIHLPVDQVVLSTLTENKRLEDLSLGLLLESLECPATS
jgi:SNF2 family DNA or RNA helicase